MLFLSGLFIVYCSFFFNKYALVGWSSRKYLLNILMLKCIAHKSTLSFCFFEKYILCVKRKTLTRHDLLLYCNLFISLKIYVSADLDSSNQKNIGRTKQECYNLFNEKIKQ
jgi:hypothetical protein